MKVIFNQRKIIEICTIPFKILVEKANLFTPPLKHTGMLKTMLLGF
jgi:hypothetical protein